MPAACRGEDAAAPRWAQAHFEARTKEGSNVGIFGGGKKPVFEPKGGYIASGPAKAFAKGSDVEIGIAGISVNQGTDSVYSVVTK